jgi:hypothetical protein
MPVPAGSNALTLGRPLADLAAVETIDDVKDVLAKIIQSMIGAGWPSGAQAGDDVYQAVFYKDGDFWGGKPSDPVNPDLLLSAAGGTIIVQDEGTPLASPVGTINIIGASISAVLNGAVADIEVTGGGGSTNSFETITTDSGDAVADSSTDTLEIHGGTGITVYVISEDSIVIENTGPQYTFLNVSITGASSVVLQADNAADTLIVNPGLYVDITGNAGTDEMTFSVDLTEIPNHSAVTTSQVIHNNAGTHTWKDAPQKVIWGIDPDGGHTITTSGTTLTLTLKVTKYTFDAVGFVSAVDENVTVTYEGTEC